jgi:hypothetical protein
MHLRVTSDATLSRRRFDYCFSLHTANNDLIAECTIRRPLLERLFRRFKHFDFYDVWVDPKWRGHGYCGLLLLNSMLHVLEDVPSPHAVRFRIWTQWTNHAAQRAYRKVFGPPTHEFGHRPTMISFST